MKQKLIFVLSLVAMAWSSTVYAVERVAPTLPTAQTPESGKSYWIYNVGTGLFLGNSSTNVSGLSLDGNEMWVTIGADGWYQLRRNTDAGYYFYDNGNNTNIKYSSTVGSWYDTWTVTPTENGYTFQRYNKNSRYNAEEFVGCPSGNATNVYPNVVDGNIVWQFFTPTDAAHYVAEVKLYQALENTNGTALEGLDWFMGEYENLYENRASATTEELTTTAERLNGATNIFSNYQAPEWNEYPIILTSSDGFANDYRDGWELRSNGFYQQVEGNSKSTLTAKVEVDQDARFVYSVQGPTDGWYNIMVYVDGVKTRIIHDAMGTNYSNGAYDRFCETLSAGTHTIEWVCENTHPTSSQTFQISQIGSVSAPLISVNLLEPGSLGTEVLYQTDHIKNVRNLKVAGKMNEVDWEKVKMMTNLFEIDLSETEIESIPDRQFNDSRNYPFFHKIALPEGLVSIGYEAFSETFIEDINFPSTLTTIGGSAFAWSQHLIEVILPDGLTSLGDFAFGQCHSLSDIDLGESLQTIPYRCFYQDVFLQHIVLPSSLKTVEFGAFHGCSRLILEAWPASLQALKSEAFWGGLANESLTIPATITSIGDHALAGLPKLKTISLPDNMWNLSGDFFGGSNALETVRLNSPTIVENGSSSGLRLENITLQVPSFLVNSYKLDPYWYNAKAIEGFSTAEIQDWIINQPLVLNARDRFEGNPNITIAAANDRLPSLKINGDAPQEINNLVFYGNRKNYVNYPGQILSNSNYVKVNGNVRTYLETDEKRWFFFSLPFDVKVSDITPANGAQYAIRYYDGANRAANGASGSWKNFEADDIIPAGTGFIYQTNISTWSGFPAVDNESKQNVVSYKEAQLTLQVNPSENTANRGWNLVGNPYQCYYNNHMLNFTAPITVWDAGNKTYTAYSLTDDDYAIHPNEAFFVQCPNEELNTISFPLQGRQLNAVIESQNAANVRAVEDATTRQLIDLEVSNGELSDKTRVVVNEKATLGYDMGSDASKFMSADAPQIYTIGEDGTEYAINERPLDEGEVQLGFYTQKSGAFTLSMPRCQAKKVYLVDEFEHLTVDLTAQDYGFTAAEGKQEARFRLVVDAGEATGIESISTTLPQGEKAYNLNGQRVDGSYKGIVIKNGKKYLAK